MLSNAFSNGREWNVEHDKRVRVDDGELRYADIGNPDGEPVLCIHGTNIADSLITPLQLYSPLFRDYRFISYYRAGYNGSTLDKSSLSDRGGCQARQQLSDHLGIREAHILASSFGADRLRASPRSTPEADTAMLLEPYLPREAEDGVRANIDAFTRAWVSTPRAVKPRRRALHGLVRRPSFWVRWR